MLRLHSHMLEFPLMKVLLESLNIGFQQKRVCKELYGKLLLTYMTKQPARELPI